MGVAYILAVFLFPTFADTVGSKLWIQDWNDHIRWVKSSVDDINGEMPPPTSSGWVQTLSGYISAFQEFSQNARDIVSQKREQFHQTTEVIGESVDKLNEVVEKINDLTSFSQEVTPEDSLSDNTSPSSWEEDQDTEDQQVVEDTPRKKEICELRIDESLLTSSKQICSPDTSVEGNTELCAIETVEQFLKVCKNGKSPERALVFNSLTDSLANLDDPDMWNQWGKLIESFYCEDDGSYTGFWLVVYEPFVNMEKVSLYGLYKDCSPVPLK